MDLSGLADLMQRAESVFPVFSIKFPFHIAYDVIIRLASSWILEDSAGELAAVFPFRREHFVTSEGDNTANIEAIQASMTDCNRPERGSEYRKDTVAPMPVAPLDDDELPDPFGIDHSRVRPIEHTAQ